MGVAWTGIFAAAILGPGSLPAMLFLFAGLFGAYWLDCADGLVARATHTTSHFGAVSDKLADLAVSLGTNAFLGFAALGFAEQP